MYLNVWLIFSPVFLSVLVSFLLMLAFLFCALGFLPMSAAP